MPFLWTFLAFLALSTSIEAAKLGNSNSTDVSELKNATTFAEQISRECIGESKNTCKTFERCCERKCPADYAVKGHQCASNFEASQCICDTTTDSSSIDWMLVASGAGAAILLVSCLICLYFVIQKKAARRGVRSESRKFPRMKVEAD